MSEIVYLIRHGATEATESFIFCGASDPPLSQTGIAQAVSLRKYIDDVKPEKIFCSPAKRAIQTVEKAAPLCPITIDDDLRGVDFGHWENRTFDEIGRNDAENRAKFLAYDPSFAFPGGESLGNFQNRVESVAEKIIAEKAARLAVFTHGGVIRLLICRLLGFDYAKNGAFYLAPASVAAISIYSGRATLMELVGNHHG